MAMIRQINEECLIFADIAGQYDAFLRLLAKAPDVLPVSLGDMIDRGRKSREVVEFFRTKGKALKGNHEHMCVDFIMNRGYYDTSIWFQNGGSDTVESYLDKSWDHLRGDWLSHRKVLDQLPEYKEYSFYDDIREKMALTEVHKHLDDLPLAFELEGGGLVTHAPIPAGYSLEDCCDLGLKGFNSTQEEYFKASNSVIWNRDRPGKIKDKFQIFGHNSMWGYLEIDDYAVCLDDCRSHKLTAMHWPSREIFQELF